MKTSLEIGLIGAGFIGFTLARAVDEGVVPNSTVRAIFDIDFERAKQVSASLRTKPTIVRSFQDEILVDEKINLIVEASAQKAVELYIPSALKAGKDVMVMSIGALSNEALRKEIFAIARSNDSNIYFPSGAIAGLDCIKAAMIGGLDRVVLTTRKPPRALIGAPGAEGLDLQNLSAPKTIFSGSAADAVKLYPANVNVAAALSLAGLGFEKTEVKIIADPKAKKNTHEVVAEGNFGRLTALVENEPSQENPKTSQLASLSAIRKLIEIGETIHLGT